MQFSIRTLLALTAFAALLSAVIAAARHDVIVAKVASLLGLVVAPALLLNAMLIGIEWYYSKRAPPRFIWLPMLIIAILYAVALPFTMLWLFGLLFRN